MEWLFWWLVDRDLAATVSDEMPCLALQVDDTAPESEPLGPYVELIPIPGGTLGMACAAVDAIRCAHDYHERVEVTGFYIARFELMKRS